MVAPSFVLVILAAIYLPSQLPAFSLPGTTFWWQQWLVRSPHGKMATPVPPSTTTSFQFQNPLLPANPKPADWEYFCRQFENYLIIVGVTENQKLPLLLNSLGRDGLAIFDGLPDPKNKFVEAIAHFKTHFSGKSSILLRRKRFYEARQEINESISDFGCRLRRLARECDFGVQSATLLRDIFVIGVRDDLLGERLLAEDSKTLTFESALARAEAAERARSDRRAASNPVISAVRKPVHQQQRSASLPGPSRQSQASDVRRCYRCGDSGHNAQDSRCRAKNARCRACLKVGHFQSVCRSATSRHHNPKKVVSNVCALPSGYDRQITVDDSDAEFHVFACDDECLVSVFLNGECTRVLADTGAHCNVIGHSDLRSPSLRKTNASIKAFGNFPLPVLGTVDLEVKYGDLSMVCEFFVVDIKCKPLLSYHTCRKLGILSDLATSVDKKPPNHYTTTDCVNEVAQSGGRAVIPDFTAMSMSESEAITDCLKRYQTVFTEGGTIVGIKHHIELTDNVKPFSPPARRLPQAILPQVKEELDRMLEAGIIREVSEPTDWCSPTVVAWKKNGAIRLCTDLRVLNKFVKRPLLQLPTFEELCAQVHGATIFTKLDLQGGFQQIPITEESQKLLCFSTPHGRFCHTRLPFGISSAPEVFQKVMNDLLLGLKNVVCYMDDCLVYGTDLKSHNAALEAVLSKLRDSGVRLNLEKCMIAKKSVDFLGHILSADGVAAHPDKLKAIREMPLPSSGQELRSFLGLAAYVGSPAVPNFASLASPLWDVCRLDSITWNEPLLSAFKRLKEALLRSHQLRFFDPKKAVCIQVDASGTGLGGVLIQEDRPVIFVSRKLTAVERRYSQLEREFLSIVFTLTRLKTYLLGISFVVQTDHKPLLSIVKKPIDKISNRLQRWLLNIQHFDFELQHISGKNNLIADGLSRNAPDVEIPNPLENCEYTICFLLQKSPIDLRQVALETSRDPLLREVIDAVQHGWNATSRKLHPYYGLRHELSVKVCSAVNSENSIVLTKGDLVVIPSSLVAGMLQQLHEGHVGTTKMKQLVRTYAYWPGFSSDIDDYVRRCQACTVFQKAADRPLLTPISEACQQPYEKIAIDLTGPSEATNGKTLLTIIDYYSRYPEAFVLKSGTAREIMCKLRETFSRFGIPRSVVSDNGTVFVSKEISSFFAYLGIRHIRTSNYHPESNGTVERFHSTLKSRINRIMYERGVEFEAALDKALYDVRSTPNAITGTTPFQRFFNRPMQTKLMALTETPKEPVAPTRNVSKEYQKFQGRTKSYHPGDLVFFRKGNGKKFENPGVIVRACGNNTFEVQANGYSRIYNQVHLKKRFSDVRDDAWHDAYDDAAKEFPTCSPTLSPSSRSSVSFPVPSGNRHSYYLRDREKINYKV